MKFIIDKLQKGENVIAPCFSKSAGGKLYKLAKATFGDSKKILMYNSENRWDGEDINVTWKAANLVIHTTSLDFGVSFEVSGHFHLCCGFLGIGYDQQLRLPRR